MARPRAVRLDYFPHDVGLLQDRKFRAPRRKWGCLAPMVYMILLELIYGEKGYYLDYRNKENTHLDILDYLHGRQEPQISDISDVINDLVTCELFSPKHCERGILTSERVQRTYYTATVERKSVTVDPDIWMLTYDDMLAVSSRHSLLRILVNLPNNEVNLPNNEVNRPNNEVDRPRSTQSKVKESKVKESRGKQSKVDGEAVPAAPTDTEIILSKIEDTVCPVNTRIRQDVEDWLRHMDASCICYAVDEAARSGARTTKYIYTILQRMLDEGIITAAALEKSTNARKDKKLDYEAGSAAAFEHYFDDEEDGT